MNTNDGLANGAAADHDRLGRFTAGNNARFAKQLKIAAKVEMLRREYFPCGGETVMDANRLLLAPSTTSLLKMRVIPSRV